MSSNMIECIDYDCIDYVLNVLAMIEFIHAWNQGGIIIDNYDISLLQLLLFWKKLKESVATTALL